MGYARGECGRFPPGGGPDAVRFALKADDGGALRLYYVTERDYLPFSHGPLEYSTADECLVNPPAAANLGRQAQAYSESYLRRKRPAAR